MNPYLRTKIMTASPEELRMMLIDGALKFSRQAHHALLQNDFEGMFTSAQRAKAICLELSTTMDRKAEPELCDRLSALYTYIYRRLSDATIERDVAAYEEAIKLLDFERETWSLAMEKLSKERQGNPAAVETVQEKNRNPVATIGNADIAQTPSLPKSNPSTPPLQGGGLSIQG